MTFPPFGPDSPFYQGFEKDTEGQKANYFGRLGSQQRKSPNQRKFFEDQFSAVQNRYMGRLGQQVLGGQAPTLSFSDYLTDYYSQGGESEQDFSNETFGARQDAANRFSPPTRFLF